MTNKELLHNIIEEVEQWNKLVPYDRNDRHDDGLHDAYHKVISVLKKHLLVER